MDGGPGRLLGLELAKVCGRFTGQRNWLQPKRDLYNSIPSPTQILLKQIKKYFLGDVSVDELLATQS